MEQPVYFSADEVEAAYEAILADKQIAGDDDTFGALEVRDPVLAKYLVSDRDSELEDLILIWADESWKEELEVVQEDEEYEEVEDEDIEDAEDLEDDEDWEYEDEDEDEEFYLDDPDEDEEEDEDLWEDEEL